MCFDLTAYMQYANATVALHLKVKLHLKNKSFKPHPTQNSDCGICAINR